MQSMTLNLVKKLNLVEKVSGFGFCSPSGDDTFELLLPTMCFASTMPFSTRNRCQNKSLNWCRVCIFSNTEVTKIGISKSKTGIVDIRINISTIKCLGSGHIFRVGRGTGNTQLIYLRLILMRFCTVDLSPVPDRGAHICLHPPRNSAGDC